LSDLSHATRQSDAWAHNARVGLILFAIYCLFYAAFIGLNAFARDTMATPSLGGVNLATIYGLGLILGAFLLALVYMVLCRREPLAGHEMTDSEMSVKASEEEGAA
jgi:uncharacterized membrane protein (DUF485 family)